MSKDNGKRHFIRKSALKDHKATEGEFSGFSFAANSITGYRLDQEDRYICLPAPNFTKDWSFFGIYDGHGGAEVAEYLKRKLHYHILEKLEELGDIPKALEEGFLACDLALKQLKGSELDEIKNSTVKVFPGLKAKCRGNPASMNEEFHNEIKKQFLLHMLRMQTGLNKKTSTSLEKESMENNEKSEVRRSKRGKKRKTDASNCESSEDDNPEPSVLDENKTEDEESPLIGSSVGSTATVLIFTDKMLYVANVGDSECISSNNGQLKILSQSHDPTNKSEGLRILESGHVVVNGRIDGMLNMSRAFGDFMFKDNKNLEPNKQALLAKPSIVATEIEELDFAIVASDGIWNALGRDFVHRFVKDDNKDLELKDIAPYFFDRILQTRQKEGLDNMSVIIIKSTEKCNMKDEKKTKKGSKRKAK